MTARIAVDAMGGDHAPASPVEGAVLAVRETGAKVLLVGPEERVRAELARHAAEHLGVTVVNASEVVGMDELPALATRQKRDSSIRVGLRLVKEGRADAFVSAGPTGALWVTAKIVLGPIEGVDRPAIAAIVPSHTESGVCVLADAGASIHCKTRQLVQIAVMGHVYARAMLGVAQPRVGLLSVGEEDSKGTETGREVLRILKSTRMNFLGNVEGNDIYNGRADVVVCDGFTGNVALKVSEGILESVTEGLRKEILSSVLGRLGYRLLQPTLRAFRKRIDYAEYGGAPLMGIRGCVVVCHGRSSSKAIKNGLAVARNFLDRAVDRRIRAEIGALAESQARLVG